RSQNQRHVHTSSMSRSVGLILPQMDVGAIRIDPIVDGVISMPAAEMLRRPGLPDPWDAHRDLLTPDGMLEMPVGGFLLRTAERVVLVDAGLGPMDRDAYRARRLLTTPPPAA